MPAAEWKRRLLRLAAWGLFAAFIAAIFAGWADERAFFALIARARPGWIVAALGLQLGTYAAEAALWMVALRRMGARAPLASMVGLALAKLFTDSVVPSGGVAGSALVVRGLEKRGIDPRMGMGAILLGVI